MLTFRQLSATGLINGGTVPKVWLFGLIVLSSQQPPMSHCCCNWLPTDIVDLLTYELDGTSFDLVDSPLGKIQVYFNSPTGIEMNGCNVTVTASVDVVSSRGAVLHLQSLIQYKLKLDFTHLWALNVCLREFRLEQFDIDLTLFDEYYDFEGGEDIFHQLWNDRIWPDNACLTPSGLFFSN